MWFGPFPVRWNARHVNVDLLPGFTDIQEKGPMSHWQHTHTFTVISEEVAEVQDRIEYEHFPPWKIGWTRLFYAPIMLRFLFLFRAFVTKKASKKYIPDNPHPHRTFVLQRNPSD